MDKIEIFGTKIYNIDLKEAVEIAKSFLKEDKAHSIITPNTEIVYAAKDDKDLRNIINSANLTIADGIGLVYASRIRNLPLKERVTGFDLSMEILKLSNTMDIRLFILGGKEGVSKEAAENIERDYPNIKIAGYHHGYFKGSHNSESRTKTEDEICEIINRSNANVLFVGLGFPLQEKWIHNNIAKLNTNIIIGNGGVTDILAGNIKRAPDIFIKLNLEWFYRLITQPSRFKRQLALPKFLINILTDKNSVKIEEE
ncbi:MAG: WecB/TagA/CpsF family glycosyltransferase [Tissierellia bacterium]|nr:WecB/TagA/CpsF family glycosyltransferase [Tissierellia bacterium]